LSNPFVHLQTPVITAYDNTKTKNINIVNATLRQSYRFIVQLHLNLNSVASRG
jgi:hypothetical protein